MRSLSRRQATRQPVVEPDLAANSQRWPGFAQQALELGMQSVASVPLLARDRVWGALDLYRAEPGEFADSDMAAAQALADVAVGYVIMAHDRDAALVEQRKSAHAATHDSLTGLPNRALLHDRLEHALATAKRNGTAIAVLFVDLDDFKAVNDAFGHHAGDQLLVQAASRLSEAIRDEDTLSRLGGDEFIIVCADLRAEPGRTVQQAVAAIFDRIHAALTEPAQLADQQVTLSASIGVAITEAALEDVDTLLRAADEAMYAAKHRP